MIGTTAGSYRITDVVSVGGMGTVYRAEHTLIGRTAAVKVLHPELSANQEIVHRFFNEAKATTSIKHPGIVEIYDYGNLDSGHAYLVMEFLEGRTLAARNKQRGPIHEAEAAAVLRGICGALAAAHAKGIVHRDLKPDNIFMVPDPDSSLGERAKILDFGIAKLTDVGLAGTATKTGAVMGTPTYMSPEQCKGTGDVDHRADLYSLGCMFYEMVAGRPPFDARGAGELIGAHLFMQPDPPSKHGAHVTPEAEALIMALLAKNPAERPQSALELGQLLANIASRGGYGSSTNWERPSMPSMASRSSMPAIAVDAPTHFTPSDGRASNPRMTPPPYTPAHYTPGHTPAPGVPLVQALAGSGPATPYPTPSHTPYPTPSQTPYPGHMATPVPRTPSIAEKPTTLSGAASESTARTGGSKKVIALIAGTAIVGGVIAIVFAMGGGGEPSSTVTPATQPTTTEAAPVETPPMPAHAKPADTAPVEAKPVESTPVEAKPAETKRVETPPVEAKPVEAKPVETTPVETKRTPPKPTVKKPVKPRPKQPTSDPLLETDL